MGDVYGVLSVYSRNKVSRYILTHLLLGEAPTGVGRNLAFSLGNTKMQNSDWNNATYHSMRSVIRWYLYLPFTCHLWCASHSAYFIWRAAVLGSLPSDHVPLSRQVSVFS